MFDKSVSSAVGPDRSPANAAAHAQALAPAFAACAPLDLARVSFSPDRRDPERRDFGPLFGSAALRPIVLVDPKSLRRRFAAGFFENAFPGRLVEASGGAELGAAPLLDPPPALVLVHVGGDSLVCESAGRQVLAEVVRSGAQCPIAVVSDLETRPEALAAIAMGARGFIPTTLDESLVVASLALVEAGGLYAPIQLFMELDPATPTEAAALGDKDTCLASLDLSPRQQEVLRLLSHGQPNKEIAYRLCMTESTVKVHVRNIMRKLDVTNRTQAAYLANKLIGEAPHQRR